MHDDERTCNTKVNSVLYLSTIHICLRKDFFYFFILRSLLSFILMAGFFYNLFASFVQVFRKFDIHVVF